jgi:putative nucleotidyltransferase with HDIG domain
MKDKSQTPDTLRQVEKIQVAAYQVKMGMFVCDLDRPWEETSFLFQGFMVDHIEQIEQLQELCDFVWVDKTTIRHSLTTKFTQADRTTIEIKKVSHHDADDEKQLDTVQVIPKETGVITIIKTIAKGTASIQKTKTFNKKITNNSSSVESLRKDLKTAEVTFNLTKKLVKSIIADIRIGGSIDTPAAKEAIAACVDNIIHREDAMLLLTKLRTRDEYTSEHSLNVAILSIALGRSIGMNRQQLNEVGLAGLLHDMGKILTPSEVLNKPGRLTDEEMEIMKQHPADGRDILLSSHDILDEAINVAYSHHERLNGSGYPRGVDRKELSSCTKIVTIADVYDAITGDRVYSDGRTAAEAIAILHAGRDTIFDLKLIDQFIQNIGIYPVGTVVEMHNGEVGIVVKSNLEYRLRPVIKLILDQDKAPRKNRFVDLAKTDEDPNGMPYTIKCSHSPRVFGIDARSHIMSTLL